MTPCFAYVRVSSEEQERQGYSIPEQRKQISRYAAANKLTIDTWFEEAHSAYSTGRPEFERMVSAVRNTGSAAVILVHKQDRISRNLTDWALLTEELGVRVLPVTEPVSDTPMGVLTQGFSAVLARYYSENLSREVQKGMRGKFEAGGWIARAPIGYRNIPRTRTEKATVVVDGEKAVLVKEAFELYATGTYSLRSLGEAIFASGLATKNGRAMRGERMKRILTNPFYRGMVRCRGETRPGAHPPIVSVELWKRVQEVMCERSVNTGEKGSRFFLLRGLLHCGTCGTRMTAEVHPRGCYYRCIPIPGQPVCRERYAPVDQTDRQVDELVRGMSFSEQGYQAIQEALDSIEKEHGRDRGGREKKLLAQRARCTDKLTRVTDGYARGTVPEAQYLRLRDSYQAEVDHLDIDLADLRRDIGTALESIRTSLTTASALSDLFGSLEEPVDRKELLQQVFSRIYVQDRRVTNADYRAPFDLFFTEPQSDSKVSTVERVQSYVA